MFTNVYNNLMNSSVLAAAEEVALYRTNQRIIGPISVVLGKICDYIFNMVSSVFDTHTLGITIIFFTIVTRILLLPLAAYSAKSMAKTRKLQPQIKRIQEKYKGKNDQEAKQRMNVEISELQRKNGANPLNGCLPLLIQMPILFALFVILQRTYVFIGQIGAIYTELANIVLGVPKIGQIVQPIAASMPAFKRYISDTKGFDLAYLDNCRELLSKMSDSDWAALLANLPADAVAKIEVLLAQKHNIEFFCGINLAERPAFFPITIAVLLPILAGATTFLTSYMMNKAQGAGMDEQQKTQQQTMLIVMPLMMAFMSTSLPAGLGVYWIAGNIMQLGQQYVFNKMYAVDDNNGDIIDQK